MTNSRPLSVASIEGPWVDSKFDSGLINRCRLDWNTPVTELTNEVLATYLRQRIALLLTVPEAEQRIARNYIDHTEMYDKELADALDSAQDIM